MDTATYGILLFNNVTADANDSLGFYDSNSTAAGVTAFPRQLTAAAAAAAMDVPYWWHIPVAVLLALTALVGTVTNSLVAWAFL